MTIETKIATNNSKVDTANKTTRLAELKAEYDNLTDALLNDENISDSRDNYLRKLRTDVRNEISELEAAIETENNTAAATTIETRIAKNGTKMYYVRDNKTGKLRRISASEARHAEYMNGVYKAIEEKKAAKTATVEAEPATVETESKDDEITLAEAKLFSAKIRGLSFAEFKAEEAGMTVEELAAKEDAERINLAKRELSRHVDEQESKIRDLEFDRHWASRTMFAVVNDSNYTTDESLKAYAIELETEYNDLTAKIATCKAELAIVKAAIAADKNINTETTATAEGKLPKGDITVETGAGAWAIVGKYFPKGNLEFYRAGKGFNNEDTFCYTLDEIIYVHVTCTPDNSRVECVEVVNSNESGSARKPLTVYIKPAAVEGISEVEFLQDQRDENNELLDKLDVIKPLLTAAEFDAKAAELKGSLSYVNLQIDAINAGDDFDYRAAAEHIENVYHDIVNFIRYQKGENGLTQEQCENIYSTVYAQCEFGAPDYDMIDRLVEECKRDNAQNADVASTETAEVVIEVKTTSNNNTVVKLNGKLVANLDNLTLDDAAPPEKFFNQFRPVIPDERQRELDQLVEIRRELTARGGQSKILDGLIEQIKRDILDDDFYTDGKPPECPAPVDFDEQGNITAIWF